MAMRHRRRRNEESPLNDAGSHLDVEVSQSGDEFRMVTTVRATLTTGGFVRVAEAKLETPHAADVYVAEVRSRKRQGLDPLAGMDPVMCYPLGDTDDRVSHSPGFVAWAS